MGQLSKSKNAAAQGVQTKPGVEECAKDMGHIATPTMILLRLDQNSTLPQLKHYQTSMLLDLLQEKDKKETVFLGR